MTTRKSIILEKEREDALSDQIELGQVLGGIDARLAELRRSGERVPLSEMVLLTERRAAIETEIAALDARVIALGAVLAARSG